MWVERDTIWSSPWEKASDGNLGICFSNSTIIPLWHPADTSKPCLSCTRQFCLDQKLAICRGQCCFKSEVWRFIAYEADAEVPELDNDVGTGTEGDVEARCFSESFVAYL